jgi:DNA-binding beta-propeller fold protein YncE
MNSSTVCLLFAIFFSFAALASCASEAPETSSSQSLEAVQDSTQRIHAVTGFDGPEAVRYDPDQDVYFVSNFTGGGNDRDANGFISKLLPDGTIESLRFMTGTDQYPLHAPRGMFITGQTLWAADVDGVHGFDRTTGEQTSFIDFTSLNPGFLNDIAASADGILYVTDTGTNTLYRIDGNTPSVVTSELPHAPNGITLHPDSGVLVLAPWGGALTYHAWDPGENSLMEFASGQSGGNIDGIEFYQGKLLAASQRDSSLHMIDDQQDQVYITTPGRPADIGLDTQRNQVAVPYIALNRVDIWQLPSE